MMCILKILKDRVHLALVVASFLLTFFLTEGLLTGYRVLRHGKIGRDEVIKVREELRHDVLGDAGNRVENTMVLHPFFGYTYNPKDKGVNNFGFYTRYDVALENSAYSIKNGVRGDLLVIGIFGSSFARDVGSDHVNGYPKLQAAIANLGPQGLIVEDLTAVFKHKETSVWIEVMC